MVQTILTPTDGSENSLRAIEKAIQLARPFEATIHAVSVIKMMPTRDRLRYDPEDDANEAIDTARDLVEQEGLEFVGATREGFPPQQIVAYATDNDIDMIVMGTHGRSGLDRVLMGSVAERTVRLSPIPVLLVPPKEKEFEGDVNE